jgi:hypothetical protein
LDLVRTKTAVVAASLALLAAGMACGSADFASGGSNPSSDGGASRDAGASFPPASDAGVAPIPVDAVVLVHGAQFPPFRLCFEGALNEQPTPSAELMPSSNVVGLDVGSAVVLPPKRGRLGKAFLFEESKLRAFYPPGKTGPSCDALLGASSPAQGKLVGDLQDDLSSGVHLVVLTGCRSLAEDIAATPARCGKDWLPTAGNLALRTVAIQAFARPAPSSLPVQALLASTAIEGAAAGRAIGLSFGGIADGGGDDAGAIGAPFVDRLALFVPAPSLPYPITYDPSDTAAYASRGFAMSYGAPVDGGADGGDAGPRETVLTQSLADVQRFSEPNAVPDDWYAVGASYVLLVVGDPDPRLADGGADPDPRHTAHLLAIPLSAPDAGRDAATP